MRTLLLLAARYKLFVVTLGGVGSLVLLVLAEHSLIVSPVYSVREAAAKVGQYNSTRDEFQCGSWTVRRRWNDEGRVFYDVSGCPLSPKLRAAVAEANEDVAQASTRSEVERATGHLYSMWIEVARERAASEPPAVGEADDYTLRHVTPMLGGAPLRSRSREVRR